MKTVVIILLLSLARGLLTEVVLYHTKHVDCQPDFYEDKVKIHLKFYNIPNLIEVINGKFFTVNRGDSAEMYHQLQKTSDTSKYSIDMNILYHNINHNLYAEYMWNNVKYIAQICKFKSPESIE